MSPLIKPASSQPFRPVATGVDPVLPAALLNDDITEHDFDRLTAIAEDAGPGGGRLRRPTHSLPAVRHAE